MITVGTNICVLPRSLGFRFVRTVSCAGCAVTARKRTLPRFVCVSGKTRGVSCCLPAMTIFKETNHQQPCLKWVYQGTLPPSLKKHQHPLWFNYRRWIDPPGVLQRSDGAGLLRRKSNPPEDDAAGGLSGGAHLHKEHLQPRLPGHKDLHLQHCHQGQKTGEKEGGSTV